MYQLILDLFAFANEKFVMLTTWINTVSGGMDFLSGMIFTALATASGWAAYFFTKTVPGSIKRRLIVSFTIDRDQNVYKYEGFVEKLEAFSTSLGSRSFVVEPKLWEEGLKTYDGYHLNPGLGFHWFFWNKRLFWYIIMDLPSSGSEKQKKRLRLMTYGLTAKPLYDFVDYLKVDVDRKWNYIYDHDSKGCIAGSQRAILPHLNDLCLNPEVKAYFNDLVEKFPQRVKFAEEHDMTYKYIGCLYGEPGSGKTSLLCSVAKAMGIRNVMTVDVSELEGNGSLRTLFSSKLSGGDVPNFLIIEDIHSHEAFLKPEHQKDSGELIAMGPSLDGLLNTLNGVVPLHNTIVFITTNYIERLDDAITRPGRTTHAMELPRLSPETVNAYMKDRIEGWDDSVEVPLRGCDLGQLLDGSDYKLEIAKEIYHNLVPQLPEKPVYNYHESNKITFGEE